jgi:hypothetical protein
VRIPEQAGHGRYYERIPSEENEMDKIVTRSDSRFSGIKAAKRHCGQKQRIGRPELMADGKYKMIDICMRCGYSDY